MAHGEPLDGAESPFLLEALESYRPAPTRDELVARVAHAARGLSPGARRHLERALVTQIAVDGVRDRAALARALQVLRRQLNELGAGERALDELEAEAPFLALESPFADEAADALEGPFASDEADEQAGDAGERDWETAGFEFEDQARAPGRRDASVAIPEWSAAERARLEPPLLSAARQAKAAVANARLHPARSGLAPDDLRLALRAYVDFDALTRVLGAAARGGGGAWDAVLIEAIHVFQRKCFLAPAQADGVAGKSTLDSLGLIHHRLKAAPNPYNPHVHGVVTSRARQIADATGGAFSAARWFDDFVNPSFLGHRFKVAVHPMLVRQLRVAERHLLAQPKYAGLTPVALGRALGFVADSEEHAGGRPDPSIKNSFHAYGLAIDVRHMLNPWIAGNPTHVNGNPRFIAVMERATRLIGGQARRIDPAFLDTLGRKSTREAWSELRELSDTLRKYLALAADSVGLRRRIEGAATGLVKAGEDAAAATTRWRAQIAQDVRALDHAGNFPYKDGRDGFLELPLDLVVALRDAGGLAWGAIDLGPGQSGDVMHFDMRRTPLGQVTHPSKSRAGARPKPKPKPKAKPQPRAQASAPAEPVTVSTQPGDPPGRTLYARVPIDSRSHPARVGIFVPERFRSGAEVDLLVYLHGLLGPCSSPGPEVDRYWDMRLRTRHHGRGEGPMALREELNASRKNVVLVAPSLGPSSEASLLGSRGGFERLGEAVLQALREQGGLGSAPTRVRHVVLAGHSKGGAHMRRIVTAADALAERVRECWGFDCFYSDVDPEAWLAWARHSPDERRLFHYYLAGRYKPKGWKPGDELAMLTPWANTERLRALVKRAGLRNVVLEAAQGKNHCEVPIAFLRRRLEGSDFLAGV